MLNFCRSVYIYIYYTSWILIRIYSLSFWLRFVMWFYFIFHGMTTESAKEVIIYHVILHWPVDIDRLEKLKWRPINPVWLKYGIVYNYCTSLNIFNNISVMLWRSVILVEEAEGPGENHRPVASNWQTLSHIVVDPTTVPSRPRRPLPWMCIKHLNIIHLKFTIWSIHTIMIILGNCTCDQGMS